MKKQIDKTFKPSLTLRKRIAFISGALNEFK